MKWFHNLKIGIRLLAAFIIVGAITATVGYMGVASLGKIAGLSKASYEQETLGIVYVKQANTDVVEVDRAAKNVMLSNTPEERDQYKAQVDAYTGLVNEDLDKAKPLIQTPKAQELLKQTEQAWKESQAATARVMTLAMSEPLAKKRASVELSFGDSRVKSDAAEDALAKMATLKEDVAKKAQEEADKTYRSSRNLLIILSSVGVLLGAGLGLFISISISKPLGLIAAAAKNIALGDLNQKIDYRSGDEVGSLAESFRAVIDAVNALTRDVFMLSEATVQDKLNTRADTTKHQGDYRRVVEGFNSTLDVVVDKVNWYQSIIDAVQLPIHVIDKDMKWVFLNKAFEKLMVENNVIKSRKNAPGMPCSSAGASICNTQNCGLVQLGKGVGETYFDWNGQNCRQESSKLTNLKGEHIGYVEVVQDLTSIVQVKNYTQAEVGRLASNLVQIAKGDLNVNLKVADASTYTGEVKAQFTQINDSLVEVVNAIQALTTDSTALVESAIAGQLGARADASKHQGDYRKIIQGVNETLDAISLPVTECIRILGQISGGNLREKVEIDCTGDLEKMKNAVNGLHRWLTDLIDFINKIANGDLTASMAKASEQDQIYQWLSLLKRNIKALAADAEELAAAAVEGKLETRVDASKHQGEYRQIIEGVNNTLDAVIGPLKVAADYVDKISKGVIPPKITDSYNGDFNVLKNNLNMCIEAVNNLVSDAGMLSKGAVEGKLATRADASKHQGEYRQIIEGVNNTLDAVIGPLYMAANYVDQISKGAIPPKITDSYNGDFNEIKNNLNGCIDSLNGLIDEMRRMSDEHNKGDIDVTIPADKFEGAYLVMAQGINEMVSGHIAVKKKAMACVAEFGKGNFEAPLDRFPGKKVFINDTIEQVRTNLKDLIVDTDMLAKAAVVGNIGVRADASKHQGDFRKIVEGVNQTLEAIIAPLKATAENASALATSSEELTAVSQQMASNAEETAVQANVVSAASEQVSRNVSSVATASEEMKASIREIAKNANDSARVAKNAVVMAQSTNETMKKLGESSQEIGNVIKVITSIAQQTNLLALNATIEAARAGEAGKGFAVVANEVKELAKQTAKATEEISQKIEATQDVTKGAVTAIEEIGAIINQINDISNSIASAVEEQTVTTNEIGRSVTEAAQGVNDIAKNIGGVATAAKNTTQGANDTKASSLALSEMAARLQATVSKFTF